ncbi:hypothetical protein K469DRAFT_75945 [Zopfia rhizophila CBS 207.26]|uniref:Uncharacterized protein n=1 Tax=Zopfia rhizophila CBS 207.26 TaxID=1314779 RepID=A0A6A6EGR4_9PEZI|nr:hypothetical protein K469DRAFT_75945 [Zopfia rhizophila CBS 207.26]
MDCLSSLYLIASGSGVSVSKIFSSFSIMTGRKSRRVQRYRLAGMYFLEPLPSPRQRAWVLFRPILGAAAGPGLPHIYSLREYGDGVVFGVRGRACVISFGFSNNPMLLLLVYCRAHLRARFLHPGIGGRDWLREHVLLRRSEENTSIYYLNFSLSFGVWGKGTDDFN